MQECKVARMESLSIGESETFNSLNSDFGAGKLPEDIEKVPAPLVVPHTFCIGKGNVIWRYSVARQIP